MGILKKIWDATLGNSRERLYSRRFVGQNYFKSNRTYYQKVEDGQGRDLYKKENYLVPYKTYVWFAAKATRENDGQYTITGYRRNKLDSGYPYDLDQSLHSYPITMEDGQGIFTRQEVAEVMKKIEQKMFDEGWFLASKGQPNAEKLATTLPSNEL